MSFIRRKGGSTGYQTRIRIEGILNAGNIRYQTRKEWILVVCPFHNADIRSGEHGLKLAIHETGKYGRCVVCGTRGTDASYNEYAKQVGLPALEEGYVGPGIKGKSYLRHEFSKKRRTLSVDDHEVIGDTLPKGMTKWIGPWRKINESVLENFPSFRWWDDASGYYRILWPILHETEVVGFTAGRADLSLEYDENDPLKYRTSHDLDTSKIFFIWDQIIIPTSFVILAEGPYDALRWIQWGLPTVCCFGAGNWSEEKTDALLIQGELERVYLAFDGDDAGDEATVNVAHALEGQIPTTRIALPEGEDPGSVHADYIRDLKKQLMQRHDYNGRVRLRPAL